MENIRKRALALIVSLILGFIAVTAAVPEKEAEAASKYIKVDEYIKYVVEQLRLPVDQYSEMPYIDAAMNAGVLKQGDFTSYTGYLTRTDCAVLANRIDKYLYGEYFGYTKEAYEFLKDCNYVNGKFYYSVKGKLYPKEASDINYSASRFLEEVVKPAISSFNFDTTLEACYYTDLDTNGNNYGLYIAIGFHRDADSELDPFNDEDYLVQAWKKIIDGERLFSAVYDKRISDLNKVAKSKRQDVAEAFAKGLFKGYSNGMYVQSRSLKGSNKVTAAGAKEVVAMAINKDKRALISPDGQLIRTTNLPKNSDEYPYILACFPNEFYEMVYDFQRDKPYIDGTMDRSEYRYPNEVGNPYIIANYSSLFSPSIEPYYYYDSILAKAEQYVENVFNVNYHTIGETWIKKVESTYAPVKNSYIHNQLDEYIKTMKANHVAIESQVVALEPSTLYAYYSNFYVRVYVKYKITADDINVEFDNELVFGNITTTYLVGLKNNEWTYGYYDIKFLSIGGLASGEGITDGALKGSK